jgi:hypothetical protein
MNWSRQFLPWTGCDEPKTMSPMCDVCFKCVPQQLETDDQQWRQTEMRMML